MTHDRANLGAGGETFARRWLEARGFKFVAANWRCPAGEIDLVAQDGAELVFVEVKTRRGERSGRAEEAVTSAKARRLLASGAAFVAAHPAYADAIWRVDLVAITLGPSGAVERVAHLPNAVVAG
ncbi:MAG TPA: YraN family protein [Thermomicrobiales bacterium]|nr:YraN family protein [Thermomicrobiales bacterium]